MAEETRVATGSSGNNPGPFLARVVSHLDPNYMGSLEVQLLHEVGNDPAKEGQLHVVKYMSPFAGSTSINFVGEEETYNNAQKSYGWWAVPPDVGSTVIVFFIEGDPRKGYWIGCVQDENMNFMTPGIAATSFAINNSAERVPVAEYNKKALPVGNNDSTKNRKVQHPFADALQQQGLLLDDIRGITSSSARREVPSSVFGISTPGPVDKRPGATKGKIGKAEHQIAGAFVSRLGGTTFVMDDGDDKFLRKTLASQGPPEYASVEQNETGGNVTIPHNELVRIRTRTGHQILLHNSEDLIYIGNSKGTTWIELTSDGKIDIFAEDSISIHTKQDLNFYADRDINLESGRNINIKSKKETQLETGVDFNLLIGANGKILLGQSGDTPGSGDLDINAKGHIWQTSGGSNETKAQGNILKTAPKIHFNGPTAETAPKPKVLKTHSLPNQGGESFNAIMRRLPTHEPWPHHENLNPVNYKAAKTDRDIDGRNEGKSQSISGTPGSWKRYSTVTDTFAKIKGAEG
jgi:hypothetical protein